MTIKECIDIVDNIKPNQYTIKDKVMWISFIDEIIINEVLKTHEGYDGRYDDFKGYSEDNLSVPLVVPSPYDRLYTAYLKMRIDGENGETARYNNSAALYNTYMLEYRKHYNKTHLPLNIGDKRFMMPPRKINIGISDAEYENIKRDLTHILTEYFSNKVSDDKLSAIVTKYIQNNLQMLKGKDGYTPKKGVDYFTDDEIYEITNRAETLAEKALKKAESITIDDSLSETSENPVQNKVATAELLKKATIREVNSTDSSLKWIVEEGEANWGDVFSDTFSYHNLSGGHARGDVIMVVPINALMPRVAYICTHGSHHPTTGYSYRYERLVTPDYIEDVIAETIIIDDALSEESENPVQNKVVKKELDKKLDVSRLNKDLDNPITETWGINILGRADSALMADQASADSSGRQFTEYTSFLAPELNDDNSLKITEWSSKGPKQGGLSNYAIATTDYVRNKRNYPYNVVDMSSVLALISVPYNTVTYAYGEPTESGSVSFDMTYDEEPSDETTEETVIILDFSLWTEKPTINLPSAKWLGGEPPEVEAGKVYMFSFVRVKRPDVLADFFLGIGGEFA